MIPISLLTAECRRIRLGVAAIALLLAGTLTAAPPATAQHATASKQLTVERIWGQPSLSGSLTSGVQWSPDGKRLSYFHRTGEGREAQNELWVLDVATGERRALVPAAKLEQMTPPRPSAPAQRTGLGRIVPQRYRWAPDGAALLFVARGHLYWYDIAAGTSRALVTGDDAVTDPKVSPDGHWVSFVREYDLWVVEVASGRQRQLTEAGREEQRNAQLDWVYPEELGIRTAYWWAPDSSRLAFLQMDQRPVTRYPLTDFTSYTGETEWMRYPKAGDTNPIVRVGVVSVAGGQPTWMDTGGETDIYLPRVEWLRDSRRLAIQRLNRLQTGHELLLADAATGKSEVILTEEDPHWINLHDDLYFFADGERFLWSSERDGFRHLYLYDLGGRELGRLTRGEWEVTSVTAVDEAGGFVYFIATEKSPRERQLYRVPLAGTGPHTPARLTRQNGTYSVSMAPGAPHFLATYSNVNTPPRQDIFRADGAHALVLNENRVTELAEYALVEPEFLTLRADDGTALHTMIIRPPDFDPARKYPVIVFNYGGPHAQIVRDNWGGVNLLWHQMMAQRGFITFQLDNRGMAARGKAFETHIHRRLGQVELADQLTGVEYLKSLPYVDGERLGIWGWSYGGYMTLYAMFNSPEVFRAGFAGAPVTDWRQYDTIYTERYMMRPQDNPEGYKTSSPVHQAGRLRGHLLIAHGTSDDNVHFANTVQLSEELVRQGRYAEVHIYPGRGHGISDARARIHLFNRVTEFFEEHLKK
jgi:dipeptidyl-peptidase 4